MSEVIDGVIHPTSSPANVEPDPRGDTLDSAIPGDEVTTKVEDQIVPDNDEPDKFSGKSREDVISSYQELESRFGKQGGELGELRKAADSFLQGPSKGTSYTDPAETQVKTDDATEEEVFDYISDPEKAVKAEIARAVEPMQSELHQLRAEKMSIKLNANHPEYESIVKDSKFHDWIKVSPIRMQQFVNADAHYDYEAAHELFTNWDNEVKSKVNKAENVTNITNDETAFKAAQLEGNTAVPDDDSPKKTYRRADIINLKMRDPDRYEALSNEIQQAYADGRVV